MISIFIAAALSLQSRDRRCRMIYRGIKTFLIIIHAAPSANAMCFVFLMDRIVSGWLISFDTIIDSNCSQWCDHYRLPEVRYRRYLYGPYTLFLSLHIYYVLPLLNSTHQRHKIRCTFQSFDIFSLSTIKSHMCKKTRKKIVIWHKIFLSWQ